VEIVASGLAYAGKRNALKSSHQRESSTYQLLMFLSTFS